MTITIQYPNGNTNNVDLCGLSFTKWLDGYNEFRATPHSGAAENIIVVEM